jgi:hypothetical protein
MTHKFINFNQEKKLIQRGGSSHWRSKRWWGQADDEMERAGRGGAGLGQAVGACYRAGHGRGRAGPGRVAGVHYWVGWG